MEIRRAIESESGALSALAMAAKAHWAYSDAQLAAWREALTISPEAIRSFPVYVAESQGHIAGFFGLAPGSGEWQLEHFWVHPSCMGQGVGKLMLSAAVRVAKGLGASQLMVESDPHAERFYLTCGAQRIGQNPAPIEGKPERVLPLLAIALE